MKNAETHECEYKSGRLVIEFSIAKDGRVPFVTVRHSSGYVIMDDYAANAIRLASPFPAVPDSLSKKEIPILASFHYVVEPSPPGGETGSTAGAGAVTLNVSDFPFAWYLQHIHRKVSEKWEDKALPGRQPVVVFEIGRDGQVGNLAVEKTSGNSLYDRAALRAIEDAQPFPPLPQEFKEPLRGPPVFPIMVLPLTPAQRN